MHSKTGLTAIDERCIVKGVYLLNRLESVLESLQSVQFTQRSAYIDRPDSNFLTIEGVRNSNFEYS